MSGASPTRTVSSSFTGSDQLSGGQYLVSAAIPPNLSELTPVAASETFASFRTTVDLRAGSRTVRMGVASTVITTAVAPAPTVAPPAADGARATLRGR